MKILERFLIIVGTALAVHYGEILDVPFYLNLLLIVCSVLCASIIVDILASALQRRSEIRLCRNHMDGYFKKHPKANRIPKQKEPDSVEPTLEDIMYRDPNWWKHADP